MPTAEWRRKNPERQKELSTAANKRRWERIKNDPEVKAAANKRMRAWYSRPENKAKALARHREKWAEGGDVKRRKQCKNLQNLYGITLAQKEAIIASQGFMCAICGGEDLQDGKWHLDHDHATGRVRGALCLLCNLMLGKARDNPTTLRSAAEYIERGAENVSTIITSFRK